MIYDILNENKDIVRSWDLKKFYYTKNAYNIIINSLLLNDHILLVKDYLSLDGKRTHSFQFQDSNDKTFFVLIQILIGRTYILIPTINLMGMRLLKVR
jgi:hypothetical protein